MSSSIKLILLLTFFYLIAPSSHASEKLYRIIAKSDWIKEKGIKGQQPGLNTEYNSLLNWEDIVSTANTQFKGRKNLLLQEVHVANSDTLLKWEAVESCSGFQPKYYGPLPQKYIKESYVFNADDSGDFKLPKSLVNNKKKSFFMPGALVSKVLHYQNWQNKKRLYKIQGDNFALPKVRLQWWYFDFFLEDSSTIVLAYIPQKWWNRQEGGAYNEGLFMISQRTKDGAVKSFSASYKPSEIKSTAERLEIGNDLLIQSSGSREARTYCIQLHTQEVSGVFNINPTQAPFAPFPTGVMPGYIQSLISGAPSGAPDFSYVSQVPEGNLSGSLKWGNYNSRIAGNAYHEQGRLDDTPENQGSCWSWYHFTADGWNIFGSPGTLVFVQKGNEIARSGFHLVPGDYGIRNRSFSSPEHSKIITGGEIYFHHKDLTFKLNMKPETSKPLIAYLSPDPNQVWATVEGPAKLSVTEGESEKVVEGRMLLETCSWAQSKMP